MQAILSLDILNFKELKNDSRITDIVTSEPHPLDVNGHLVGDHSQT